MILTARLIRKFRLYRVSYPIFCKFEYLAYSQQSTFLIRFNNVRLFCLLDGDKQPPRTYSTLQN
jgi:hypothetical protein